jgi:hypothetical protein
MPADIYGAGMATPAEVARNRYAIAVRHGKPSGELERLRRDLELSKLTDHVKKVATSIGPLSESERQRIAELLDTVK